MYRVETLISYLLFRFMLAIAFFLALIQSFTSVVVICTANSNTHWARRRSNMSCILRIHQAKNQINKQSEGEAEWGEVMGPKSTNNFSFSPDWKIHARHRKHESFSYFCHHYFSLFLSSFFSHFPSLFFQFFFRVFLFFPTENKATLVVKYRNKVAIICITTY